MNSAWRTGRLSHPVSAPAAAFLFSPGGAACAARFCFYPCPARGVAGVRPGRPRAARARSFPSNQWVSLVLFLGLFPGLPTGLPAGLQAFRRAGCTLLPAAAGGAHLAVLPGRAAVFPAEPPFLPACPPLFGPNPLFRLQRRVQAFYRLHDVCTLRRRQGCTARAWGPAGGVSLRVSPRPRAVAFLSTPRRFLRPYIKGKKINRSV